MGIEPTGKPMTITGQAIYRIVGGKIKEDWINADTLGMLQQLGVVACCAASCPDLERLQSAKKAAGSCDCI